MPKLRGDKNKGQEIILNANNVPIHGTLAVPENSEGIVIFAHGSGSGRFSPRNRYVAGMLQKAHIATLLIDLLSPEEEKADDITGEYRFNIDFLAARLLTITHYIEQDPVLKHLKIGYFGASTGSAGALVAAAQHPEPIEAIVSRGGRPDLAGESLMGVKSPVLLLVGGEDYQVVDLNKQALEKLTNVKNKELVIIPGATHLFEEPGKLEEAASYAKEWFKKYLTK
ncbi:alpha/beta hydrolase [Candidatus Microgenomates bacterium]|nr:MAG: alpha/beta hydrolase [Candidatus Microgenomates bacterium]